MNRDRFKQIIEAYGTKPEHWPETEQAAARSFLTNSTEAQSMLREFESLDGLLDSYTVEEPRPTLSAAILTQTKAFQKEAAKENAAVHGWALAFDKIKTWFIEGDDFNYSAYILIPSTLVLLLCAVLGLAVGSLSPFDGRPGSLENYTENDILALAFASEGPEEDFSVTGDMQ